MVTGLAERPGGPGFHPRVLTGQLRHPESEFGVGLGDAVLVRCAAKTGEFDLAKLANGVVETEHLA
jgi:hypothetical protein